MTVRGSGGIALIRRSLAVALVALALLAPHVRADVDRYEVYAVRFATLADFPVSSLVAGADRSRRMDIAMMIWVLKGVDGRIAIVDSGFHRERYFTQFTVKDYIKPSDAIAPLGIKPDDVTDLLLVAHALGPRGRDRPVPEGARLGAEGRVRLLHRRGVAVRRAPTAASTPTMCWRSSSGTRRARCPSCAETTTRRCRGSRSASAASTRSRRSSSSCRRGRMPS